MSDRPRPEYQPIGGRLGSFFLYPTVHVSANATDNVRATTTDRISDVYFVLASRAKLQSNFSRHALDLQVFAEQSVHTRATSEDVLHYGGQLNGIYDISRDTRLTAQLAAQHRTEPRTSYNTPSNALEPPGLDRMSAYVTGQHRFGRLDATAIFNFTSVRYDDVALESGDVSQRYRDADVYAGTLVLGYRMRPGMSVIARGAVDKVDYALPVGHPLQPSDIGRNSKGFRVEGGLRFDLTSLLYGEVRAGYFKRNYTDARLVDSSGLSFGAELLWNVTPLTSVQIEAERRVDEAASTNIAGLRTSVFSVSIDHELRRNVILSADARYVDIKPLGEVRPSDEFNAGVGARMLVTRRLSLRAGYRYAKRSSAVMGRAFRENLGTISADLTF